MTGPGEDEAVERVARALYAHDYSESAADRVWSGAALVEIGGQLKALYRSKARAAIAAYRLVSP